MKSEEQVRNYLRLINNLIEIESMLGRPPSMQGEKIVLLWVLGEFPDDPPGMHECDQMEESIAWVRNAMKTD